MFGWAALQRVAAADGLGVAAALLSGAVLVYTLFLSRIMLGMRFQETSWLGALIVAVGVAASGPYGMLQLTSWSRIIPVFTALSLSGLALVGKEALLKGVPSDSGDGSWKRRPMSLASVACLASVSQLLALALPQVRSLEAWPGLAGIGSIVIGPLPKSGSLGFLAVAYICGSGLLRLTLAWALRAGNAPIVQLVNALAVPYGAAILALLEPSNLISIRTLAALLACFLGSAIFFVRTPIVKDEKQLTAEKTLQEQERDAQDSLEQFKRKREAAEAEKQAKAEQRQLSAKLTLQEELRRAQEKDKREKKELTKEEEQIQKEFLQQQKLEQEQKQKEASTLFLASRKLSPEEQRLREQEVKRQREQEEQRKKEEESKRLKEEEARKQKEEEAQRIREEEARRLKAEKDEKKKKQEQEEQRRNEQEAQKQKVQEQEEEKKRQEQQRKAKEEKMRMQRLSFKWKMEDDTKTAEEAAETEAKLKTSEEELRLKLQKEQEKEEDANLGMEPRRKEEAEAEAEPLEKDQDTNRTGTLRNLLLTVTGRGKKKSAEEKAAEAQQRQEQREEREAQKAAQQERREAEREVRKEEREAQKKADQERREELKAQALADKKRKEEESASAREVRAPGDQTRVLGKMWETWIRRNQDQTPED